MKKIITSGVLILISLFVFPGLSFADMSVWNGGGQCSRYNAFYDAEIKAVSFQNNAWNGNIRKPQQAVMVTLKDATLEYSDTVILITDADIQAGLTLVNRINKKMEFVINSDCTVTGFFTISPSIPDKNQVQANIQKLQMR